jgi:plastocyanin
MTRQAISTMIAVAFVIVLVVVVGVGYYVLMPSTTGTTTSTSQTSSSSSPSSSSTSSSSTSSPTTSFSGPAVVCTSQTVTANAMVTIEDFLFTPKNISISAGQSVQWTYDPNGQFHHTVTSNSGLFGSASIFPGESYTCTFKVPGVYGYHCSVHPTTMKDNFVIVT